MQDHDRAPRGITQLAGDLNDEIVKHFTAIAGATVSVTLELRVHAPQGFDADTQRIVNENCNTLKFKEGWGFQEG